MTIDVSALVQHTVPGTDVAETVASVVMHTIAGGSVTEAWVATLVEHSVQGGMDTAPVVDMLVMHTILDEAPDAVKPDVIVEEDEACPPADCCVPALNRLIELRLGPLKTLEDHTKALQETQNRLNILIREFNKLAAISQEKPPSV